MQAAERSSWPALDDGRSLEEIHKMADAVFANRRSANLDTDADGSITNAEARDFLSKFQPPQSPLQTPQQTPPQPPPQPQGSTLMDKITQVATEPNAEVRDFLSKFVYTEELVVKIFSGIDVDASGDLSAEELREAFVKFPALRTAPGLGGLENTEVRSTWPAADDGASAKDIYAMADAVFANLDANSDGIISKAEFSDWLTKYNYMEDLVTKMFSEIDVDASGGIDPDELRAAFVKFPTLRTSPGLGAAVN